MKKNMVFLLSGLLLCLMGCTLTATNKDVSLAQLRDGFNNPPKEAQVCIWWHWLDGNVTREGITADLEAMHRVGIHEATLFNGGMGFPQGPIEYMSDEWLALFQHAASEAKHLGMELSFHNGPGWSSSGSPWIKPEDAMQTVTWSEQQVEGGRKVCLVMPKPKMQHECYKDIAVLAFPAPQGDTGRYCEIEEVKAEEHQEDRHCSLSSSRQKITLPSRSPALGSTAWSMMQLCQRSNGRHGLSTVPLPKPPCARFGLIGSVEIVM